MMSAKIRVKQVLLVEGKYDAAKLSSLVKHRPYSRNWVVCGG